MWSQSYEKEYTGIKKEAIWSLWKQIDDYPSWHHDLEICKLEGEFKVGHFFRLKPKGGPEFKVYFTEIIDGTKFTDVTQFFGAKMYDTHEVLDTPNGIKIRSTISVTGLLSFFWIRVVAKNVANSAPDEMDAVVALARKKYIIIE